MPKVYVSGSMGGYGPHSSFGECTHKFSEVLKNPKDVSLVIIPGGADINPKIYGHKANPTTHFCNLQDKMDIEAINFALTYDIPIAGICRGGQLLIAMAGGFLYQHTSGHGSDHLVKTNDDKEFEVTSCHHQMYGWPLPEGSKLIAWSKNRRSKFYDMSSFEAMPPPVEPECVWIPSMKALATQWHPEWMFQDSSPGAHYYDFLIEKYLKPEAAKKFDSLKA